MQRYSRRTLLGSAAVATAALAGCSSGPDAVGGDGSNDSGGGDGSNDSGGGDGSNDSGGGDGSSSSGGGDEDTSGSGGDDEGAESDALQLDTLAVEGSPGDEIAIDPTGSPVLLDFFATWCAPCKPQMEHLRTIDGEFDGLLLRSVTRETDREAIASFWRDYEGTWPVAMDPELLAFETYGVTRVPVLVVLDPSGTEVWRHAGLASADSIRTAVREARA